MATLNLPLGNQAFPDAPYLANAAGMRSALGLLVPGVGQVVAYVRATPMSGNVPPEIESKRQTTIKAALKLCRAGMGDAVCVLPGHTEVDTDGTIFVNAVAGSRLIGLGSPDQDDAPTINLTATASQIAIAVKNFTISGMRLQLDGANGVVKAINITAAGCKLLGNYIRVANGAALKATIAIEVGSAAHQCTIRGNRIVGTATHNVTNGINVVGATPPSDLDISDNVMQFSATAANGCVNVTVASLRLRIKNNEIYNTMTSSSAAINVANVAADGLISDNYLGILLNGAAVSTGLVLGAAALVKCFQNFACDEPIKSGLLNPAVAT